MRSRWDDAVAKHVGGVDALLYATHLIGAEPNLVLWGGGNSSAKLPALDHTGRTVRTLWIKGSGSDMRTMTAKQFTPLRLEDLLLLAGRDTISDEDMVEYQRRCMLDPGAPKPSIETLLHAFLPSPHIYHTHADAICTLTDTADSAALIHDVYGEAVPLVPYVRPGFGLAKLVAAAVAARPNVRAVILDKHGLVTWGDSPKAAYLETIRMVSQAERFICRRRAVTARQAHRPAETATLARRSAAADGSCASQRSSLARLLPVLRGAVSRQARMILRFEASPAVLTFVNHPRAAALCCIGPFTPDHMLHTKPMPLFLDVPDATDDHAVAQAVRKGVEAYRDEYVHYFEHYKTPGVTMLDPHPRVILVRGVGMITTGKDPRAAAIAADLYRHTMRVSLDASTLGTYTTLPRQDQCDFEYWPMENYKLTLLPPEKPLSRRVALITGAAGAIGKALASRLVREGACVILADVDESGVRRLAEELNAGTGPHTAMPLAVDITKEDRVAEAFRHAVLAYGGVDILVSNAGIARSAPVEQLTMRDWDASFAVNATGHFLVCREAMRLFRRQGLGGTIVVVSTKNVLAPGKDFGPYSASKAAQAQLARVLAVEGAEIGVRVNMVNPDAIFDGSGLWTDEIREARATAYGIPVERLESHYASRCLLKTKVTADDVAEAVLFLASDRSAKTTGAMIPVDGGHREAFPR